MLKQRLGDTFRETDFQAAGAGTGAASRADTGTGKLKWSTWLPQASTEEEEEDQENFVLQGPRSALKGGTAGGAIGFEFPAVFSTGGTDTSPLLRSMRPPPGVQAHSHDFGQEAESEAWPPVVP